MRRRVFRALLGLDTATFAGKGAYKLNELLAEDARAVGRVLDLVVEASKAMGKILIGLTYLALASPISEYPPCTTPRRTRRTDAALPKCSP